MKKVTIILLVILLFSTTVFANSNTGENDLSNDIALIDGKYSYFLDDGTEILSPFPIKKQKDDGKFIIYEEVYVNTPKEDPGLLGQSIIVEKYGIMDENFNILIEPILDNPGETGLFDIYFDENGISQNVYDSDIYTTRQANKIPHDTKNMLINSSYKVWQDYDVFYDYFITEDRFVVKDDGISYLIDGDLNIIADEYTHIIELANEIWHASKDRSQINPVYSIVIDNNGNVLEDFDINALSSIQKFDLNDLLEILCINYKSQTPESIGYIQSHLDKYFRTY